MSEQKPLRIKSIDITPHKSIMPKIGQAGYSVGQALSELVDNSLDARYDGETLHVNIKLNSENISVDDDGKGMNEAVAEKCLKLAHSEKKNQLGEFGLGLKTASQSLGKRFSISTTQRNNEEQYALEFDEEEWLKSGDWTKHPMKVHKSSANKSGTEVKIDKLKIKFYPNLVTKVKEELSLRFAPFISNGELVLKVNNITCVPEPMELTEEGKQEFSFKISNGKEVHGWIGLMKSGYSGNKGYYGFNTYRRGRLITQYDKVGFNPHPEYRRIIGELFMDDVPVTHNKREWIKESGEYLEVENKMRDIVKPFLNKSRNYENESRVSSTLIEKMDVQEEIIAKAIKNTPELKQYAVPNVTIEGESKKKVSTEIEKRDKPDVSVIQEVKEPETEKDRNPKKKHKKKKYELTINGRKFKFTHKFEDLEDKDIVKQVAVSPEKGIEIFTNISFPAFSATKDSIFYATMNIAEGIAEIMVREKGEDKSKIFALRDMIMKKTAEIMRAIDEEDKLEKEKAEVEKKLLEIKEKKSFKEI